MRDAAAWLSQPPAGLARHVRLFSTRSRMQQLALYVKQPCTSVVFDCHSAAALAPKPDEQEEEEEASRVVPRKARKDKRSGAMIEAMARDAARRHAPHEPEGVAAPKRKKKKTGASGGGMQLSIVYDE